jgi:hypothetical protein
MCDEKDSLIERLTEHLLDCEEEIEDSDNYLKRWTEALGELAEIEDAFRKDEKEELDLHCKTILDIGTDCVKPLYLALKYSPLKIVGIDEGLLSLASEIENNSKLFTKTKIGFHNCSIFNEVTLSKVRKEEQITEKFDFVLVSKTLHHLRRGECIAKDRDEKHTCSSDEKDCINKFEEQDVFKRLLDLGKRVVVYEHFDPIEKDDDKIRGRGGYFTSKEWERIFRHLSNKKYKGQFITPEPMAFETPFHQLLPILRGVDTICFYIEQ